MKVLLVDNDELVRSVLAELLDNAGYEVVETGDPFDAFGLPEALGPPDVLIADIGHGCIFSSTIRECSAGEPLPHAIDLRLELNGFEVASYAHHLWPKVRVILTSGEAADHTRQSLDPRDHFIQKPFSNERLLGAVEELANQA